MAAIDDLTRLRHMRDATKEALSFMENRTKDDLEENRMLQLAIIKDLEIIGEAANNITQETKEQYPQIPWRQMIGMRNRLVHAYFGVNIDVIWKTRQQNLPTLLVDLEAILQQM